MEKNSTAETETSASSNVRRTLRREYRVRTKKVSVPEEWFVDSLRALPRAEQLWIQSIVMSLAASAERRASKRRQAALARAHRFAPPPAPTPDPASVRPSSCCGAESYVWRRSGETLFLRCSACTHLCEERPAYALLRVVEDTQDGAP